MNPDEKFLCPCESGLPFKQCCEPYLQGDRYPATAVALMRSRYTAFVKLAPDYLRQSWHPDTCPAEIELEHDIIWKGLQIVSHHKGKQLHKQGTVEFKAFYRKAEREGVLHEVSRFVRYHKRWVYLDGEFPTIEH